MQETRVEENTQEQEAEMSTEVHEMTLHEQCVLNTYTTMKKVRSAFPWEKLRRQLTVFDDEEFESIIEEFKRFITIKTVQKDFGLNHTITFSPSAPIDLVWHATMLWPREYAKMCFHVCDDYIDHNPDGANDTQDKKQVRYEKTLRSYEKMFLQKPQSKFWPTVKKENGMQIFVKTLTGKTLSLEVAASDSVETLKELLHEELGFPPDDQRILFAGRQLEEGKTLADYGIQREATMHVQLKIRGC